MHWSVFTAKSWKSQWVLTCTNWYCPGPLVWLLFSDYVGHPQKIFVHFGLCLFPLWWMFTGTRSIARFVRMGKRMNGKNIWETKKTQPGSRCVYLIRRIHLSCSGLLSTANTIWWFSEVKMSNAWPFFICVGETLIMISRRGMLVDLAPLALSFLIISNEQILKDSFSVWMGRGGICGYLSIFIKDQLMMGEHQIALLPAIE